METVFDMEPVVLVYRRRSIKPLERALLLSMVLMAIGAMVELFRWEIISTEILRSLLAKLQAEPLLVVPLCVAIVGPFLVATKMRRTRISIDARGIQMHAMLPILGEIVDHKIEWCDVGSVSYVPNRYLLVFKTGRGLPWVVRAADWVRDDSVYSVAGKASEPYLVGVVRRLGLMERKPATNAVEDFDLMGDPRTRMVLGLCALAGLYALIDCKLNPESWAFLSVEYQLPHAVVAVLAGLGAAAWLSRRTIQAPTLDRPIIAVMAIFVAFVAVLTSNVAGTRLNQWLGGPLEAHVYHRDDSCLNLVPQDPALPAVEYTEVTHAYWCQISPSKDVQVLVRRGLFGLYQFNLTAQTEAIHRFRDGN